ncbi:hypothetical protein DY000_02042606 [Brassica cretica]|uniref:F-box domain-containing protein n=2 Tax=Brassica cretica TaxID=69181 RepID=A0ABQ7BIZ6_BRACR|nr:hypothetical protein DY000_02042606 [Brassica cretica]
MDRADLKSIRDSLTDMPGSAFFSTWDFIVPDPWSSFSSLTCTSLGRVTALTLGPNLSGSLSPSISKLAHLTQIFIYPGLVTGPLPSRFDLLPLLILISLTRNSLTGPIPNSLSSLSNLHSLDLSYNQLSGSLPPFLTTLPRLRVLVLASNNIEEILYRLPPKSLVRFRAVSKRWNSLFNNKSFINKHLSLSRPQFIFLTQSKIYSIDIIDQTIHLRELQSSCRELNSEYGTISTCDGLLFCKYPFHWKKETALWNPWSRQVNLIKLSVDRDFTVFGLGYDNSGPQKVHKILLYYPHPEEVAIYECACHVLRYINTLEQDMYICDMSNEAKGWPHVSLNGNLYWIAYNRQTCEYFIQSFNFSNEIFKPVCLLPPFEDDHSWNEHLLAVWKGDRFSLLQQCFLTRKIGIWVTKDKADDKKEVVWINLMTLTAPNLPFLCNKMYGVSYFIYDKTLFMCCGDGISQPCIHIAKGDMCNKIQIGYGEDGWFSHCAYVPNLNSAPLEFQIE